MFLSLSVNIAVTGRKRYNHCACVNVALLCVMLLLSLCVNATVTRQTLPLLRMFNCFRRCVQMLPLHFNVVVTVCRCFCLYV